MSEKRTCYIITPVENEKGSVKRHMDGIINAVLMPVLSDDYEVLVDYRIPNPEYIDKQVLRHIYHSDLMIAFLSENNPNVMYQLAFRHSIGSPVIMIAEEGTIIPLCFNEKTIFYINDAQGVLDLIEKLISYLETIDFKKVQEGPIYDCLRDILNEENIVKNVENVFEPLSNILKEDEIEEINETEFLFFRDLIKEENINKNLELEFDKEVLKKEIVADNGKESGTVKAAAKNEAAGNDTLDNSIINTIKKIISKMIDIS